MTATAPAPAEKVDAIYYEHAARLPLARRVSFIARRRLCRLFFDTMQPSRDDRILDVGVSDEVAFESNMLEQLYPYPENLTCASLTDGLAIQRAYPAVTHQQITPHESLPFEDNSFDIVYSNAVLEHAGNAEQQWFFLSELCRVARRRFVVVPNPLFPIEHHTGLPLINYLPKPLFRHFLRRTRYHVWSREENLNYLSASALLRLWPDAPPHIAYSGVGFGCFQSNLVAYNA
jgi:hypothetical protein